MKNALPFVLLLPLACALAACGDDTEDGSGGSSSDSTSADTTGASTSATTVASSSSGGDGGAGGESSGSGFGGSQGDGGFSFGDPIDAPDDEWTFVDFETSRCMNDTPTGIAVNPSSTNDTDLVIFLNGGNACFNAASCAVTANKNGYDAADFEDDAVRDADLFDRAGEPGPISDWSFVYVPYCTGDLHFGDRKNIEVGGQTRNFRGGVNIHEYLERLVPTFPNVTRVLLTGVSAGGLGASLNYDQVKKAFGPDVDVYLLDDSGPTMSAAYIPPCLQQHFRDTWGYEYTLPAECEGCSGDEFAEGLIDYLTSTYGDQRLALISSLEDATIRTFLGFGNEDCANIDDLAPPPYPADLYTEGLEELRATYEGENFRVFYPDGDRHVWINDQEGLDTTIGGSPPLVDWIEQLITDDPDWQSWPAP
jgi:hypothetical protein